MLHKTLLHQIEENIDTQFENNQQNNIYHDIHFTLQNRKVLHKIRASLTQISAFELDHLSEYYTVKFVNQFYVLNQYIYFSEAN